MVTVIAVINGRPTRITLTDENAYDLVDLVVLDAPAVFTVGRFVFHLNGGDLMLSQNDVMSDPINTDPLLEAAARYEAANS